MNAYKRGIEGDFGESVLDGVETGFSSIGKGVRARKMVFSAECAPLVLLRCRQHQTQQHFLVELDKTVDRAQQDGSATYTNERLGNAAAHAKPLTTGYDDDGVHFSLICWYIMPCLNWSAASLPQKCSTMA